MTEAALVGGVNNGVDFQRRYCDRCVTTIEGERYLRRIGGKIGESKEREREREREREKKERETRKRARETKKQKQGLEREAYCHPSRARPWR